jgi:hypothetical protein
MSQLQSLLIPLLLFSCASEVSREKRPLVDNINTIVSHIDSNHRVQIIEDDYKQGDSVIKIRGYSMDGDMLKLVAVTNTTHSERDDYFYFNKGHVIFSGHLVNDKDELQAEEYKFYYAADEIGESLFWKDHYKRGARFPHESFKEFYPKMDSLLKTERQRIQFLISKLETEGFEIKHLNENLEANIIRVDDNR